MHAPSQGHLPADPTPPGYLLPYNTREHVATVARAVKPAGYSLFEIVLDCGYSFFCVAKTHNDARFIGTRLAGATDGKLSATIHITSL